MSFIDNVGKDIAKRIAEGVDCKRCKKKAPLMVLGVTFHCVSCGETVMLERIKKFRQVYLRWPWYGRVASVTLFALGVGLSRDGTVHLSSVGSWIAMLFAWRYAAQIVKDGDALELAAIGCEGKMRRAHALWLAKQPPDVVAVEQEKS